MALTLFRDRARAVVFHWPAVLAGLFVALGIHIAVTALGLATALSETDGLEEGFAAFGLLLWSGFAWLVGSFVGGYVTAWVANATRYVEGMFHGLVLWGMLTFALMFLPPNSMGVGAAASEPLLTVHVVSSVAWFVAVGSLLSFATTIGGALIGSRVVERVDTQTTETYKAA